MSTYNIEMNTYNGSTYDQLYPITSINNVTDLSNQLSAINSSIENIQSQSTGANFIILYDAEIGPIESTNEVSSSTTIELNDNLFNYSRIYCFADNVKAMSFDEEGDLDNRNVELGIQNTNFGTHVRTLKVLGTSLNDQMLKLGGTTSCVYLDIFIDKNMIVYTDYGNLGSNDYWTFDSNTSITENNLKTNILEVSSTFSKKFYIGQLFIYGLKR